MEKRQINRELRLLSLKIGGDEQSAGLLEHLRTLIPGIWVAGISDGASGNTEFDEVITSHYDAYLGTYEKVFLPTLPMSPELHRLIVPFEGQALNMLERVKLHDPDSYPKLQWGVPQYEDSYEWHSDLFWRHCRFWNYVLDHYSIDAVVSQNFGHQGYDFTLLSLAKAKGIPTLIFNETSQFPMVQFVQEDVQELGRLQLGLQLKNLVRHDLVPESPNFIRRSIEWIPTSPDRFEVSNVSQYQTSLFFSWLADSNVRNTKDFQAIDVTRALGRKLQRRLGHPVLATRSLRRTYRRSIATRKSMREERDFAQPFDSSGKYIYFPLHFQPEATTSVKGRHFYRLREAAAFLASEVPSGWKLVVKEHPHQWRRLLPRPTGFYSQLAAIPNLHLVHHTTNNQQLVAGAQAVACVSHSSITAFAVTNHIPVISLGASHFREAPGYFCIDSTESLRQAISQITSDSMDVNESSIEDFIQKLENSTFEGLLGYRPSSMTDHDYKLILEQSQHNLSRVIAAWLAMVIQPLDRVEVDQRL